MAKEVLTDSTLFLRETAETALKQTKARRKIAEVLIFFFYVYFLFIFFDFMIDFSFPSPVFKQSSSFRNKLFFP